MADARFYVRRLIRQRAGEDYAFSGSHTVKCRRVTRLRMSCDFGAYTANARDFEGIEGLHVVTVPIEPAAS